MDAVAAAWDPEAYVALLGKLVGEAKHLQNGAGHTPTEDRGACRQPSAPPSEAGGAERLRGCGRQRQWLRASHAKRMLDAH